jgi:hypothetical protein
VPASGRMNEIVSCEIQGLPGMLHPKRARTELASRTANLCRGDQRSDP